MQFLMQNSHVSVSKALWFYIQIGKPYTDRERIFYGIPIRTENVYLPYFLDNIKQTFRVSRRNVDNLSGFSSAAFR